MRPFVTTAPQTEPPIETTAGQAADVTVEPAPVTPAPPEPPHAEPPCTRRPDLHATRRMPHRAQTPRHRAAAAGGHDSAPPTPAHFEPDCRRFTEFALRSVLETLDRRRHPAGLTSLLAPTPLDLVTALTRAGTPGRRLGPAALRRVHIRHLAPGCAEVFGAYDRGDRTFAIAGRVEHIRPVPTRTAPNRGGRTPAARGRASTGGWMVTSLQVG